MEEVGILSMVATPIGNLGDITYRAIEVLGRVDYILAEDTRQSKKLLNHYNLKTPLRSFHAHSADNQYSVILSELLVGKNIALVTDAGTPGISDPGSKLIQYLVQQAGDRIRIEPIPGPSAVTALVSVAGFADPCWQFWGFVPTKKGRETFFKKLLEQESPTVCYESSHRIVKTLTKLAELSPDKEIVIGRELTKQFETIYRGTVAEVLGAIAADTYAQKGEFVFML